MLSWGLHEIAAVGQKNARETGEGQGRGRVRGPAALRTGIVHRPDRSRRRGDTAARRHRLTAVRHCCRSRSRGRPQGRTRAEARSGRRSRSRRALAPAEWPGRQRLPDGPAAEHHRQLCGGAEYDDVLLHRAVRARRGRPAARHVARDHPAQAGVAHGRHRDLRARAGCGRLHVRGGPLPGRPGGHLHHEGRERHGFADPDLDLVPTAGLFHRLQDGRSRGPRARCAQGVPGLPAGWFGR